MQLPASSQQLNCNVPLCQRVCAPLANRECVASHRQKWLRTRMLLQHLSSKQLRPTPAACLGQHLALILVEACHLSTVRQSSLRMLLVNYELHVLNANPTTAHGLARRSSSVADNAKLERY